MEDRGKPKEYGCELLSQMQECVHGGTGNSSQARMSPQRPEEQGWSHQTRSWPQARGVHPAQRVWVLQHSFTPAGALPRQLRIFPSVQPQSTLLVSSPWASSALLGGCCLFPGLVSPGVAPCPFIYPTAGSQSLLSSMEFQEKPL